MEAPATDEKPVKTLMEGLLEEMDRVREIIAVYKQFPAGQLAAAVMEADIEMATKAIAQGDTVEMLRRYDSLKGWEL